MLEPQETSKTEEHKKRFSKDRAIPSLISPQLSFTSKGSSQDMSTL